MATFRNASFARIIEGGLKRSAQILEEADVEFLLIGSLSAWALGGPESSHDLDFGIREEDAVKAAEAFLSAGWHVTWVPENWLIKAWVGDPDTEDAILIDLIYAPSGIKIGPEVFSRAKKVDVLAHMFWVLDPTDLLTMKVMSIKEPNVNYTSTLATARSIREQVDWELLRKRTEHSPFAAAFFVMCEQLGVIHKGAPVDIISEMHRDKVVGVSESRRAIIDFIRENQLPIGDPTVKAAEDEAAKF